MKKCHPITLVNLLMTRYKLLTTATLASKVTVKEEARKIIPGLEI